MKIKDVIEALNRFPDDYELEYHEGNNYQVSDEFEFNELKRKEKTIVMQGI